MLQKFILPWPPSANRYWRYVNGRVLVSSAARNYIKSLSWFCRGAVVMLPPIELAIDLQLYPPNKAARDGHNYSKVLLDALEGVLYVNDRQVTKLSLDYHKDDVRPQGAVHLQCHIRTKDCECPE